ncbi:hypothetical protein [Rhodococcus sp. ARC_M6]|uniref:hypothetical protein n=1 Tax=Rhodococcus sp. ARC_M6 TaxID=2928852 RepID=UPI001FB4AEA3|nr:hypothetical protein [Rhodococcus sp. ARC_M6]MCJ0907077.1 hypothetical protein [Rhodococcus sp. ARC_M6]
MRRSPDGIPIAGIELDSHHGDGLTLWGALRTSGRPSGFSSEHHTDRQRAADARDPSLVEAMRLLDLVWVDRSRDAWV